MIDYDFVTIEMNGQSPKTILSNLRKAVMPKLSDGWTVHGQPFQQGIYLCQTITRTVDDTQIAD